MMKTTHTSTRMLVVMLLFFGLFASAQTPERAKKITAAYNTTYLKELATKTLEKSKKDKKEGIAYARAMKIPIAYTTKKGAYVELQRVLPDGTLIYYKTDNVDAAKSTRVNHINTGGSTGFNLDGQNMVAYVWDAGHPRVTHQEYGGPGGDNRVAIMDADLVEDLELNFHAAHVVGTIAASGVNPQAKGMAPQAKVRAYQWDNDLGEATTAAANGMLVSNHSYGLEAEEVPDQWFGAYQVDAVEWDNLMFTAPYYLMVNSAGNDGEDETSNASPLLAGYDKLNGTATAKNNLVVAATNDAEIDTDGNIISVTMAPFSNQGPTDDLRIKPDIAGNGVGLYSTYDDADDAYNRISGTSMSSPNVTGSLLLLQQHYHTINGNFMRAATLKGLALHTADDIGPVGPDALSGWGLMNTKRAAQTITKNGAGALIQELIRYDGTPITLTVNSDGLNDLMASISWTDRPGIVNSTLNSTKSALVNDLDIKITKADDTYYPWRLTSATENSNDGGNIKDPFERVDVKNASGTYTITISHKGIKGKLVGGSQAFSLIVTGLAVTCVTASVPENIRVNGITGTSAVVSWNLVPGALYDVRYRKVGATSWIDAGVGITDSNYILTGLAPATNFESQVRSKCPEGAMSEYSAKISFSTSATLVYCTSGSEAPDPDFYMSNVKLNTIDNTSTASTYSDFRNLSTELVAGQVYTISLMTTSSGNYKTSYSVWIDYNQNERFDDPGEQVFAMSTSTNKEASGSFTIPSGISPLSTTMRVSVTNDENYAGPCDVFTFGEVEDYTIHIGEKTPLGLGDNHLLTDMRLFPNPLNDNTFYITAPKLNGETVAISVNDMLGREIFEGQQTFSETTLKVDLSQELKSGVYMVTISSDVGNRSFRIIKR